DGTVQQRNGAGADPHRNDVPDAPPLQLLLQHRELPDRDVNADKSLFGVGSGGTEDRPALRAADLQNAIGWRYEPVERSLLCDDILLLVAENARELGVGG